MGVNRLGLESLVVLNGMFLKVTRLRFVETGLWITLTRLGFKSSSFEFGIGELGILEEFGRLEVL